MKAGLPDRKLEKEGVRRNEGWAPVFCSIGDAALRVAIEDLDT